MMEDYNALNQESKITQKHTEERTQNEINTKVSKEIRDHFEAQKRRKQKYTADATRSNLPPNNTTKHNR